MLAPHFYEEARRNAPHVVVIELAHVEVIGAFNCAIHGKVLRVERGRRYKRGDAIVISAPAIGQMPADPPIGGVIFQNYAALAASRFGRAYLSDTGELVLSQYEIMQDSNARPRR